MKSLQEQIFRSQEFTTLAGRVGALAPGEQLTLGGAAGSLLACVAALIFERRPVLIVASGEDRAEQLRDDCSLLSGEEHVRFYGGRPAHRAHALDVSSPVAQIETLKALVTGDPPIVVAFPASIAETIPPPGEFSKTIVELRRGEEYSFRELIARLEGLGFERKDFVESYGDLAVRGGILDVFPYAGENPVRFEFWGDTIESVREFDVLSQRSIRELQAASVVAAIAGSDPDLPREPASATLFDYLRPGTVVILDDPAAIRREIDELQRENAPGHLAYGAVAERASRFPVVQSTPLSAPQLVISSVSQPAFNGSIDQLVASLSRYAAEGYTLCLSSDTREESERLKELIEDVLTAPGDAPGKRREQEGEEEGRGEAPAAERSGLPVTYLNETLHAGFVYHGAKLLLFTEHGIFNRLKRRGLPKRRRFRGFSQKELSQLKRGNYVVHVDHGIGVFDGLKKIRVGGIDQEVMKVRFLEEDVLYVNLNFISRVQKYSSQEGHVPNLARLGSPDWDRAKARAKRRIKDIARDLMKLYARRKNERGFQFSPDTHWQRELEASFMYDDTPDQADATLAVKQDMEIPTPMDRLVCGDVGFGKTEVAVRAAFKAVMDGKQVCILVPTTILAIQHYNTFQDRLARYTTKIEHLSRFKSKREQGAIVEALRAGSLDIVIGTHRLLSKDIAFKDLGLLVIDEEHRFGVSAKEKLRQLKATVDTLTLTATPIPRTLHFSLMGARDLSIINTPPRNRLPIVTEIISASEGKLSQWNIIREAIVKELQRGGQVYVVHDRVQNIDAVAEQVKAHVPEARVHVAHGQMSGHELEKTMLDFLEKRYDVLVATKIIESGLDIPSVNTIVINRADRFGLAELYQLRGRVGRSNVQAYAYLLVPPLSALPKQTLRRLQAVEEFTELGSGFNLAMRDLEIRGAGNIFGAEQSGFIMEMGFEMYERIVREAVEELKREEFAELFRTPSPGSVPAAPAETVIESDLEAYIPEIYIDSDTERLDVYRRLYRALSRADVQAMREELRDRFGEGPEEVEQLFRLIELRLTAARWGITRVSLKGEQLTLTLPAAAKEEFYGSEGSSGAPFELLTKKLASGAMKNARLQQQGEELTLQVRLQGGEPAGRRLDEAEQVVTRLFTEENMVSSGPA